MIPRYDRCRPAERVRPHVLVVDDEPANLRLIKAYLTSAEMEVTVASDGPSALALLDQAEVNLVLLDVRMPGMNGFEVCQRIREDERKSRIPVVFLTAEYKDLESELRGFESGADEYLHKPVERRALVARVRSLLRLADAERERRMASQLAQAEKFGAIGQIAAGVGHEINNPLSYILSNLNTLKGYLVDIRAVLDAYGRSHEEGQALAKQTGVQDTMEEISALIRETAEGGARVREIVQQLKTYSRADDTDKVELVDLAEVVSSTLLLTERELASRARIEKELRPAVLMGPTGKLHQLVLNLVVNAHQAIPDGAPDRHRLRVRTWTTGNSVVLAVSDSGVGIPAELQSRVFEPFFTTKPVGVGTGLGLSFCASVASKLGGAMSLESTPGEGSTFLFTAPGVPQN